MKIRKLIINTKSEKYPIVIGSNLILNLSKILSKNLIKFKKCLIVIDKNVPKKHISIIKKKLKNKKNFFSFH